MVLTAEHNGYILMAHFRSGTRNPDGSWRYLSCIEQFLEAFPNVNIGYDAFRQRKHVLVKRFEEKHCICKGKSIGTPTVLTYDIDIQRRIEASPKKSVSQLAAQTGLSVGTCHKALTKLLHMHPYNVPTVTCARL